MPATRSRPSRKNARRQRQKMLLRLPLGFRSAGSAASCALLDLPMPVRFVRRVCDGMDGGCPWWCDAIGGGGSLGAAWIVPTGRRRSRSADPAGVRIAAGADRRGTPGPGGSTSSSGTPRRRSKPCRAGRRSSLASSSFELMQRPNGRQARARRRRTRAPRWRPRRSGTRSSGLAELTGRPDQFGVGVADLVAGEPLLAVLRDEGLPGQAVVDRAGLAGSRPLDGFGPEHCLRTVIAGIPRRTLSSSPTPAEPARASASVGPAVMRAGARRAEQPTPAALMRGPARRRPGQAPASGRPSCGGRSAATPDSGRAGPGKRQRRASRHAEAGAQRRHDSGRAGPGKRQRRAGRHAEAGAKRRPEHATETSYIDSICRSAMLAA